MLKIVFNIINIISFILYSDSKLLNINDNSIITIKYKNNNKFPTSIYLNNIRFRESSLLPSHNGLFSIGLKKGNYKITSDSSINKENINFSTIIEKGNMIKSNSLLKTKLIKKNKYIELEKINYYQNKNHKIRISSMINLKKYYNKYGKYQIYLLLNNKVIFTKNSTDNVFTYLSDHINIQKGNNIISLKAISYDNIWCSCMEINDGFNYGRHLTSWIINENKNKNQTRTLKQIEVKINKKPKIITNYNIFNKTKSDTKYNNEQIITILQNDYKFNYYKLLAYQY